MSGIIRSVGLVGVWKAHNEANIPALQKQGSREKAFTAVCFLLFSGFINRMCLSLRGAEGKPCPRRGETDSS